MPASEIWVISFHVVLCITWVQGQDALPTSWQITNTRPNSCCDLGSLSYVFAPRIPGCPPLPYGMRLVPCWAGQAHSLCKGPPVPRGTMARRDQVEIAQNSLVCALGPNSTSHHPTERTEVPFVSYHKPHYRYIWERVTSGTCLFTFVHPGVPTRGLGRRILCLLAKGHDHVKRKTSMVRGKRRALLECGPGVGEGGGSGTQPGELAWAGSMDASSVV